MVFNFTFGLGPKNEPPNFKNIVFKDDERSLHEKLKDYNTQTLVWAFKNVNEKTAEANKKKSKPKKFGSVSLSNMDTVNRCAAIKARLNAKLSEILSSDLAQAQKMTLARDIASQISNVDQKIAEIRRRETAVREEKAAKKNEPPHVKRKRKRDMAKQVTSIRRDYLYAAAEGGMDPNALRGIDTGLAAPAVSFDIGGTAGTVSDIAAAAVSTASIDVSTPDISADVIT